MAETREGGRELYYSGLYLPPHSVCTLNHLQDSLGSSSSQDYLLPYPSLITTQYCRRMPSEHCRQNMTMDLCKSVLNPQSYDSLDTKHFIFHQLIPGNDVCPALSSDTAS